MINEIKSASEHQDLLSYDLLEDDQDQVINELAEKWAKSIVEGTLKLKDLKAGLAWANAMDREFTALYGSEISDNGKISTEFRARRILHHAGRSAVQLTRTELARLRFRINRNS